MVDLSKTIIAKSDQLNADDLIGKSITIKITKVTGTSDAQQPIAIHYEGDEGKPYKPCKSMRRILVGIWGVDGAKYVGRSMTLYRDDKVRFGGIEVGGIRISHMSDIDAPKTMALTASKANKKAFTVQPLKATKTDVITKQDAMEMIKTSALNGTKSLLEAWKKVPKDLQTELNAFKDEQKQIALDIDNLTKGDENAE